jgi:hypothetical protein
MLPSLEFLFTNSRVTTLKRRNSLLQIILVVRFSLKWCLMVRHSIFDPDMPDLVTASDSESSDDEDFYESPEPSIVIPEDFEVSPTPSIVIDDDLPDLISDTDSDYDSDYGEFESANVARLRMSSQLPRPAVSPPPPPPAQPAPPQCSQPNFIRIDERYVNSFRNFSAQASVLEIVVDTGCSAHMVPDHFNLQDETPTTTSIQFGTTTSPGSTMGNATVYTSSGVPIKLSGAIKVKGLSVVLLSVHRLFADGYFPVFRPQGGHLFQDDTLVGEFEIKDGIYFLRTGTQSDHQALLADTKPDSAASLWHCRLGHLNRQDMQKLNTLAYGIQLSPSDQLEMCDSCCKAKSTRKPFQNLGVKAERPFQYVYTDVVGPFPVETPSGFRYFIGLTDKFTSYTFVQLMRQKSDVLEAIKTFYSEAISSNFYVQGATLQFLSSDRGGEFFSNELKEFLRSKGIQHQSAPGYTPEFNAIQERMNRTLVEMALSMLFQAALALCCWGLAVECAAIHKKQMPYCIKPGLYHSF